MRAKNDRIMTIKGLPQSDEVGTLFKLSYLKNWFGPDCLQLEMHISIACSSASVVSSEVRHGRLLSAASRRMVMIGFLGLAFGHRDDELDFPFVHAFQDIFRFASPFRRIVTGT